MHNLKKLSDTELHTRLSSLTGDERRLQTEILRHLEEVHRRKLHLAMGYASLHEYAVQALHYTDAAAQRRIGAMRLMSALPETDAREVEQKLSTGALNVTTLSQLQTFIQAEKREQGKAYSLEAKRDLLATIEGKSTRATEKLLASISRSAIPRERERAITDTLTELRIVADAELMALIERAREVAPASCAGSTAALLKWLTEKALKQIDPARRAERAHVRASSTPAPESPNATAPVNATAPESPSAPPTWALIPKNRHVPARTRHLVWRDDQARCTFTARDGRRCGSRTRLQLDHLQPYSRGGAHAPDNLRLLCSAHHSLVTERTFGLRKG